MVEVRSNSSIAKGTTVEPMYIYCAFKGCGDKIHTSITSHWLRKHPEAYIKLWQQAKSNPLLQRERWS